MMLNQQLDPVAEVGGSRSETLRRGTATYDEIRVAYLDDHPAVRIGIERILRRTPDLVSAGSASTAADLWKLIDRSAPDVVLLDYHHPGYDGLELCLRIKADGAGPTIVLYTGQGDDLLVAAALAGIDGIVGKSSETSELLETIRSVVLNGTGPPNVEPAVKGRAARHLDPADHAILAMRIAGNTLAEIADTLWLGEADLAERIQAMIAKLVGRGHSPRSGAG